MVGLYQELEQEVIGDIARRIKKTERYTETAEIMARTMTEQGFSAAKIRADVMRHMRADVEYQRHVAENTKEYKAYVKSAIKETVQKAKKNGSEMVAEAGTMSYNDDLSMWEQAGKDLSVPNNMSQIVEAAAKQTACRFHNLAKTAGFRNTAFASTGIIDLYQKEVDMALLKTAAGTFSYGQAVNDCIHRLAQSGLRSIDYASGRSYQLDTAVRMSVRTGLSQMSGRITEENIKSTGVDLVITSQHAGSRPEHVPWQNQVFSYDGKNKKYPDFVSSTGYGSVGGLKGINCTHGFYPFWEGISKIPEDIKEPDPVTVDGKEYTYNQAQQRQRKLETDIRAVKREIEAQKVIGGDTRVLSAKLRVQTADYKKFSMETGLRAKTDRLRVQSGTTNLRKTDSYKRAQRNAEYSKSGALNDKNDPLGKKRDKHAKLYYEEIRNRKPSYTIRKIAKNAQMSEHQAEKIYKHIFVEEHRFKDGKKRMFDPDYDMSESIRRILEGKNIKPHDITMIKHENLELNLMKKYNMVYEDAHDLADKKYNYAKELLRFLDKME